jgi:hypothetical protein
VGPRFVCPYFTNAGARPPGDRLSAVIKRSVVKTRKRERDRMYRQIFGDGNQEKRDDVNLG